jgi:hypothetical protein
VDGKCNYVHSLSSRKYFHTHYVLGGSLICVSIKTLRNLLKLHRNLAPKVRTHPPVPNTRDTQMPPLRTKPPAEVQKGWNNKRANEEHDREYLLRHTLHRKAGSTMPGLGQLYGEQQEHILIPVDDHPTNTQSTDTATNQNELTEVVKVRVVCSLVTWISLVPLFTPEFV